MADENTLGLVPERTLPPPRTHWKRVIEPRVLPAGVRDIGIPAWIVSRVGGLLMGGGQINAVETFARNRRLFWGYLRFAFALVPLGKLARRDIELVTLRTAWNAGVNYEWAHHVVFSGRAAGFSTEDIERIAKGPEADGWTAREKALLIAADELHADRMITDNTWATLTEFLSDEQLVELCFLVGHYEMIGMCLNSFGVTVEDNAYQRGPLRYLTPHRQVDQ